MPRPTELTTQHPTALSPRRRLLRRVRALLGSRRRPHEPPPEHMTSPVMDEVWPSDIDPPEGSLGDGAPPAGATGRTPFGAPTAFPAATGTSETDTNTLPG
jgi:hypothetical protein